MAIRFSPSEPVLAVANDNGELGLISFRPPISGDTALDDAKSASGDPLRAMPFAARRVNTWKAHNSMINDLQWRWSDESIVTVSTDSTVKLWDANTSACLKTLCSNPASEDLTGHTAGVKCVAVQDQTDIIATGGRDGRIFLWDFRLGSGPAATQRAVGFSKRSNMFFPSRRSTRLSSKVSKNYRDDCDQVSSNPSSEVSAGRYLNNIDESRKRYQTGTTDSRYQVSSVAFLGSSLFCSASSSHVRIWDLRKTGGQRDSYPIFTLRVDNDGCSSVASLAVSQDHTRLLVSTTDGKIHIFNFKNEPQLSSVLRGRYISGSAHSKAIFSPDGNHVISGSDFCSDRDEASLCVWSLASSPCTTECRACMEPYCLGSYSSSIGCVDWSTKFGAVACGSDDSRVQLWGVGSTCESECCAYEEKRYESDQLLSHHNHMAIKNHSIAINTCPKFLSPKKAKRKNEPPEAPRKIPRTGQQTLMDCWRAVSIL